MKFDAYLGVCGLSSGFARPFFVRRVRPKALGFCTCEFLRRIGSPAPTQY